MAPAVLVVVSALLAGALPPPPKQTVLSGRGTFGEIHFDHEAHLGRRIACKACHGPGPVHKPELSPAWGHETCRSCHVEQKRGPTSCRECHQNVREGAASTMAAAPSPQPSPPDGAGGEGEVRATPSPSATSTATSTPTATSTATPMPTSTATQAAVESHAMTAAAGGAGAPHPPPLSSAPLLPPPPPPPEPDHTADLSLRRAVRAGITMMSGADRTGAGLGVGVTLEQGHWVAESMVGWSSRPGAERTLVLFGLGAGLPIGPLARARAVALCGVDAGSPAYVLPAVGVRAGVELRSPHRSGLFPSADLSIAYVDALGTRMDASGLAAHESAVVFSVLFGWQLPSP